MPSSTIQKYSIEPGDYGIFEENDDGILIKPVHDEEIKT